MIFNALFYEFLAVILFVSAYDTVVREWGRLLGVVKFFIFFALAGKAMFEMVLVLRNF